MAGGSPWQLQDRADPQRNHLTRDCNFQLISEHLGRGEGLCPSSIARPLPLFPAVAPETLYNKLAIITWNTSLNSVIWSSKATEHRSMESGVHS